MVDARVPCLTLGSLVDPRGAMVDAGRTLVGSNIEPSGLKY